MKKWLWCPTQFYFITQRYLQLVLASPWLITHAWDQPLYTINNKKCTEESLLFGWDSSKFYPTRISDDFKKKLWYSRVISLLCVSCVPNKQTIEIYTQGLLKIPELDFWLHHFFHYVAMLLNALAGCGSIIVLCTYSSILLKFICNVYYYTKNLKLWIETLLILLSF